MGWELTNPITLKLPLVFRLKLVAKNLHVIAFNSLEHYLALPLEVLGMLLEAAQDSCSMEVILEELDLSGVRKVVAPGIEGEDVHPWLHDAVQVLIQALFGGQFSAAWEMVVELARLHCLVGVLIGV